MKIKKKKFNRVLIGLLFILIALIGVGIMMYPIVASQYAESVRSEIHSHYEEIVKEADTTDIEAILEAAQKYNQGLAEGSFKPLEFEENGYYDLLKLPDTDVLCYVSIPKINVTLPVYHGVNENALGNGAGHMPQSSLPVGGENTHAVISAHTGMAQSPMFSDLELLEIGDIFQIRVLDNIMTYEVDDISVVLPHEVETVKIQEGQDYVSLVTCTPYGINSHRLVVRGHRIENPSDDEVLETLPPDVQDEVSSVWLTEYWQSVKIGAYIALGVVVCLVVVYIAITVYRWWRKKGKANEQDA